MSGTLRNQQRTAHRYEAGRCVVRIANVLDVWDVIWPMAAVGALSPSITVIVLAILMNPDKPRQRAFAFWGGAVLAMLFWALLVSSAVWGLIAATESDIKQYSHRIDFVLGILLVTFAFWRIFGKKRPHPKSHRYSKDLSDGPLRFQVLFGALMQGRNVTSVVLFCAAQQHIITSRLPMLQAFVLTLLVIGVITASIWLAMLLPISATDTLHTRLAPARDLLAKHTAVIEVSAALIGSAYLFFRAFG